MRVLACVLTAAVLASAASGAAAPAARCPGGHGRIDYSRGSERHQVDLATCADRVVGTALSTRAAVVLAPNGRIAATVRVSGTGRTARQTIWVTDRRTHTSRAVFTETEYYKQVSGLESPGPIVLLRVSDDGRWVFFAIDPDSSASIAADGLILRVVSTSGGDAHELGVALAYPDYVTWCSGRAVWIAGDDRIAIHAKQLLQAAPPDWRPTPLWGDPARSFASPACSPDQRSVAVLSQRSGTDANFFHVRWRLWRVGLDGRRTLLDVPPRTSADGQPTWSPDGRSVAFVRDRYGHAALWVWRAGRVRGPYASLGYGTGYYGHWDWGLAWPR